MFDPRFIDRSPMLASLRPHADALQSFHDWPTRNALQSIIGACNVVTANGLPVTLAEPSAEPYEKQLYLNGELQFRERDWHDLLNVLAWLAYPHAKRELNRRHYFATQSEGNERGRSRDALTLFDESGAIVVTSEPSLLDLIRNFEWKALFQAHRVEVRANMRVYVFGHALMQKALDPYIGLTAHALLLVGDPRSDSIDDQVAAQLRDARTFLTPQMLAPLPVLGVPGWWRDNEDARFYENTDYFRRGRRRSVS